jgi:arylsulfatase A-like enzyme
MKLKQILAWVVLAGLASQLSARPANVVFILLDNLGQEWLECYGGEAGVTPEIDKLAAGGVRVEHCYTPPVCGPSRVVALTGRYPHTTGFRLHHDAALYSGGGLDPDREILFPRLFQKAGFVTGITGKWQVNNLHDEPGVLDRHGFDHHLVWPGSLDQDLMTPEMTAAFWDAVRRESAEETVGFIQHIESRYWDPVFFRQGARERLEGKYGPDVSLEFTRDFITKHREKPFLLYLPMVLTHGRAYPHPVATTPLNRDENRPHEEMFADMVRYADRQVGEVVRLIEQAGLRDDTFVVVATDNGTEQSLSTRRSGRLVRGGLYTMKESGGSVGLLFNCPARIPGGRTIELADFTDLYPTFCELAGVELDPAHPVDGKSLARVLLDPSAPEPREWILNEYHQTRVVRDRRYKLYSEGAFFDVSVDFDETTDLAADQRPEVAAARAKLQTILDSLPPDNPEPFPLRSQSGFKLRTGK